MAVGVRADAVRIGGIGIGIGIGTRVCGELLAARAPTTMLTPEFRTCIRVGGDAKKWQSDFTVKAFGEECNKATCIISNFATPTRLHWLGEDFVPVVFHTLAAVSFFSAGWHPAYRDHLVRVLAPRKVLVCHSPTGYNLVQKSGVYWC